MAGILHGIWKMIKRGAEKVFGPHIPHELRELAATGYISLLTATDQDLTQVQDFVNSGRMLLVAHSSNVYAIQYNQRERYLYVHFVSGRLYRYQDISPEEASLFAYARSKGEWVWEQLRRTGKIYVWVNRGRVPRKRGSRRK